MCVCVFSFKNYYIVIIRNDYAFSSTTHAHVVAEFATHLVMHVLQRKDKLNNIYFSNKKIHTINISQKIHKY